MPIDGLTHHENCPPLEWHAIGLERLARRVVDQGGSCHVASIRQQSCDHLEYALEVETR